MARMNDWQREIHEARRREGWSLRGPSQIVKVIPRATPATELGGYITLGRFLLGKTPLQTERALGWKHRYLEQGARIYRFTRLPMQHEYEYELTVDYPDGLLFNPAHSDVRYLPGSPKILQRRIRPNVQIPVDSGNCLELQPGEPFPYGWLSAA